jgi:hypothetical protein
MYSSHVVAYAALTSPLKTRTFFKSQEPRSCDSTKLHMFQFRAKITCHRCPWNIKIFSMQSATLSKAIQFVNLSLCAVCCTAKRRDWSSKSKVRLFSYVSNGLNCDESTVSWLLRGVGFQGYKVLTSSKQLSHRLWLQIGHRSGARSSFPVPPQEQQTQMPLGISLNVSIDYLFSVIVNKSRQFQALSRGPWRGFDMKWLTDCAKCFESLTAHGPHEPVRLFPRIGYPRVSIASSPQIPPTFPVSCLGMIHVVLFVYYKWKV